MAYNGVRYVKGDWNAICDVCAQKYKASSMRKRWDGLMVCPHDWEPRHPQDFLRAVPDRQAVPWSRPRTEDVFVPWCPYPTSGGLADVGTADCALADYAIPMGANAPAVTEGAGPFPLHVLPNLPDEGDSQVDNNMTNNFDING